MTGNQMFGAWGALLMSFAPLEVHLGLRIRKILIYMSCSKEYRKVIFHLRLKSIVQNLEA